jgi:transcriptional regulator with XRE-family HTH domain
MKTIGDIIKYYRKTHSKMSQKDLGVQALGLSDRAAQARISRLESGAQIPTVKDLQNIEKVLDLDPGTLERELKDSYFSSKHQKEEVIKLSNKDETVKYPNIEEIIPDLVKEHPALIEYLQMLNAAARIKNYKLMVAIVKNILDEIEKKNGGDLSDNEELNCATV